MKPSTPAQDGAKVPIALSEANARLLRELNCQFNKALKSFGVKPVSFDDNTGN